ncbi:L-fucose:H+ symporter permease [Bacteroidales bacterium]|nr:L-fucose:H+ symporter permease [Bacteroidales bacterium]
MENSKPKVVAKQYLVPFILLTSLFFLWGIANDLTNPMVLAFKKVMPELSNFQSAFVQLAFYGGYATMAIPAALFIRKYSYKTGLLVGLSLYAIGALMFYPAAKFEEFNFFLISLYILTFGLAFLETTSNPFVLSMGDPKTATRRLNLAQTFNPPGSLLGMFVAQMFVIKMLDSSNYTEETYNALPAAQQAAMRTADLGIISIPYISLGFFVIFMFIMIFITKMPKKQKETVIPVGETFKKLLSNKRYYEGVITQAFYVGAQIMCWTFIFQYVDYLNTTQGLELTATWYNVAAMVAFLVGRAASTALLKYISPGKLMFFFAIGGVVSLLGAIFLVGMAGLYCLVFTSVCMSLMFPTIYGIALRDMGDEAKLGSAGLVMAIVGGALMPPLQGKICDIGGSGFGDKLFFGYVPEINISFVLPLISLTVVAIYAYRAYTKHMAEE